MPKYTYPATMTGSSNLNVDVGATTYYTGSSICVRDYTHKSVIGEISGSVALGSNAILYMAVSMDGARWNYWYKSGSITSGSSPIAVIEVDALIDYIAPVIYNASGSALSGSVWARAY